MIKRLFLIFTLLIITSQPVYALSGEPGSDPTGKSQRQIIEQTPWLDPTACDPLKTPKIPTQSGGPATPGQTWFMGDSLTYGLKDFGGLEEKLTAKGFTPNRVNDRGGRSIISAGGGAIQNGVQVNEPGNGLQAVQNDAEFIRGSKNIIIALGTNDANISGGTKEQIASAFTTNLTKIVNDVKAINPSAKLFWVDVAAVGINKAGAEAVNTVIYEKAQELGYTPISQFKFVWGDDQDPKQISSKTMPDPNNLLQPDGIHFSGAENYGKYAEFLVNTLANGGGSTTTSSTPTNTASSGCKCVGGSSSSFTILEGGDNAEKAFNFLISKGLNAAQAAGIVGNLMAESNVDPTADNDINGGHHGIAQWDQNPGGRYENLKKFAAERGVTNPDELGIQLEFLWFELPDQRATRGIYKGKNFLEASINNTNDPEEAAVQFHDTFERSNDEGIPIRKTNALSVFQSFGSNNPTPGSSSGSQSGTGSCGGVSSNSSIDPNLPQGTPEELLQRIKDSGKVTANVDLLAAPGVKTTTLAVVLKLTEKYSFSIGSVMRPNDTGSAHAIGTAVDLGNINGEGVPTGENYEAFNQIAADFIRDAATILPAGGSYIGTPNAKFEAIVKPIITAKGGSTLIETRANGLAQGAHFHLNVPAGSP